MHVKTFVPNHFSFIQFLDNNEIIKLCVALCILPGPPNNNYSYLIFDLIWFGSGQLEFSVLSGGEKHSGTNSSERETLIEDVINSGLRMKEVDSRLKIRDQEVRNPGPGPTTVLKRNQIIVCATVHMVE